MPNPTRSKGEELRRAAQKKATQSLKLKERARQEKAEYTAKLRALRLAREAADTSESSDDGPDKAARLPQVHRQQS